MKKGLFLSHDGVNSSIFESQVFSHVERMGKSGMDLDILTFEVFSKAYESSVKNHEILLGKNESIRFFLKKAFNIYIPFSSVLNTFLFILYLIRNLNAYSFIHARTEYSAFIALMAKPFHKAEVIWDCRGDTIDELKLSLSKQNWFIKYFFGCYWLIANYAILAFVRRFATSAIFVSEELKRNKAHGRTKRLDIVVPCAVNADYFYFNDVLRARVRKDLSYSEQDVVLIYCGSMVQYQGIELSINFFREMLDLYPFVKVLIITTHIQEARILFENFELDRIIIRKVPFCEVNNYYNAADAAVLFREDLLLNKVASPTKFGEYCMSGLPVVMNNTVEQVVSYSKKIGNYCFYAEFHPEAVCSIDRNGISLRSRSLFSRASYDVYYESIYLGRS